MSRVSQLFLQLVVAAIQGGISFCPIFLFPPLFLFIAGLPLRTSVGSKEEKGSLTFSDMY